MLQSSPSSSDCSDIEDDNWITRTKQDNNNLKPPAHQNGTGPRTGSPNVVDSGGGGRPGPVKTLDTTRAGSPSPSLTSEKTLTETERAVMIMIQCSYHQTKNMVARTEFSNATCSQ